MDKKQTNKTFISLQTSIYTGHRKWNEIYSFLLNLHKFTTISGIAWKQNTRIFINYLILKIKQNCQEIP